MKAWEIILILFIAWRAHRVYSFKREKNKKFMPNVKFIYEIFKTMMLLVCWSFILAMVLNYLYTWYAKVYKLSEMTKLHGKIFLVEKKWRSPKITWHVYRFVLDNNKELRLRMRGVEESLVGQSAKVWYEPFGLWIFKQKRIKQLVLDQNSEAFNEKTEGEYLYTKEKYNLYLQNKKEAPRKFMYWLFIFLLISFWLYFSYKNLQLYIRFMRRYNYRKKLLKKENYENFKRIG